MEARKVDVVIKTLERMKDEVKQAVAGEKPMAIDIPLSKTLVIFNVSADKYEKIKELLE